ncbi:MAG: glycosyltransferase family 39 protein [Elusimicrobiota bacterium]
MTKKISIFFAILLLLGLAIRLNFTFFHYFDADEFVNLHSSWLVAQNLLPYRDFHQFYTPLFWYLLYPLFIIFKSASALLYSARFLIFLLNLGIFYYTYQIAKFYGNKKAAWLALILLSFSVIYLRKSIEVRPDVPLTLLGLIAIYYLIKTLPLTLPSPTRGEEKSPHSEIIKAGLSLGLGLLFVQKGIFYVFGLTLGLLLIKNLKKINIIYLLTAVCLPISLLTLFYFYKKSFPVFFNSVFLFPLQLSKCFPAWETLQPTLFHYDTFFWIAALLGMIRCRKNVLLLTTVLSFFIYVFFMATAYYQYYLPFLPLLAIFGGLFLKDIKNKHLIILLCLGLLQPLYIFSKELQNPQAKNKDQIKLISYLLSHTAEKEIIFDSWSEYIFRPHAYPVFQIGRGLLKTNIYDDIPKYLREKECKILLGNGHLKDLKPGIVSFLGDNYIHSGYDILYLAGKQFHISAEQTAEFELIASGNYSAEFSGKAILVDGKPIKANEQLFLSKGLHTVHSAEAKEIVFKYILEENR